MTDEKQNSGTNWSALPLLLTVSEVAELLRKTPAAVYAMVERGQLPGVVKLDRRSVRIRREHLMAWIKARSVPSASDRDQ